MPASVFHAADNMLLRPCRIIPTHHDMSFEADDMLTRC
jgi:hypothetical protein